MKRRDKFTANMDKRQNVIANEKAGNIADTTEIRMALMEKVRTGESTLEEVQAELKKIKRDAKKNGKITKSQAFNRG